MDNHSLWKTGFFNYLREDITFSLMNRRVLKTDLAGVDIPDNAIDDEDRLNIAALYLAEAINIVFRKPIDPDRLHKFSARYSLWEAAKPSQSAPYYDSSDETFGPVFPTIRLLRDCHVAVAQYSILVRSLMLEAEPQSDISRKLQHNATRLCGMAFTSDSPAILVNSFGPVSYCGRHVTQRVSAVKWQPFKPPLTRYSLCKSTWYVDSMAAVKKLDGPYSESSATSSNIGPQIEHSRFLSRLIAKQPYPLMAID